MLENMLSLALAVVSVFLVILVLLQRSDGGMGALGGSGGNALMSGAATGNALTRATAILATLFFALCIALAALSVGEGKPKSVVDNVEVTAPINEAAETAPAEVPAVPSVPDEVQ